MSKPPISKQCMPTTPTGYSLAVSYSVCSQQLGSVHMLSSCISDIFCKHLLKPPWQAARNHVLIFSEQSHERIPCSPVWVHSQIRNLTKFNTSGAWPFYLAKKFTIKHIGQVKLSAWWLHFTQLSICNAITQPVDLAVTWSKLS